jgi:Bacterial protein of unknown function (DUF916)
VSTSRRLALGVVAACLAVVVPTGAQATTVVHSHAKTTPLAKTTHHKVTNATFGAGPANLKGSDGRTFFTFDTTAGGSQKTHIEITNSSFKTEVLAVYAVDAVSATNGTISFPGPQVARRQAGAWISIGTPGSSGEITLKPRSTDILPIHVAVPTNASPGDHVGAVVVSLTGFVVGTFGQSGVEKVKFEQRIAIRALFRVAGPLHPLMTINNLKASYHGPIDPFARGQVTVSYVVQNGGNVVLGGPQAVSVQGWFGEHVAGPAIVAVPALLPGASYPVRVVVRGVYPELVMSGTVTVTPEGISGQVDPGLRPVSSTVHFLAIPWILLIVVLLMIVGLAGWYWRRRRRLRGATGADQGVSQPQEVAS